MNISSGVGNNRNAAGSYLFTGVLLTGIFIRLLVVLIPGNGLQAPWSGGGDAAAYVRLAQNIVDGKGYSYAGIPSAFRPPLYPGTLAMFIKLFGRDALLGMRLLQFLEGVAVVVLCGETAVRIFGTSARNATLVIALFFPTLVALSGEIQTETLATLFSAIFMYLLVRFLERPTWGLLIAMSAITGMATLARSNMALFGFIIIGVIFFQKSELPKWRSTALAALVSGLVISPWVIRNEIIFHGQVFLSTQSGINAAATMVEPTGRSQPGETQRLQEVLGWVPPEELELNVPKRLLLPTEPALNRREWQATFNLWRQAGWKLVPLGLEKISFFWLSTDQLFWNQGFRLPVRVVREGAVLGYWGLLAFAVLGWSRLRERRIGLLRICVFYAILVTAFHMPFAMNTRIGVPFIAPWVAMLAGAGVLQLARRIPFLERRLGEVMLAPQLQ